MSLTQIDGEDYISLIDIAKSKNNNEPKDVVKNWLRNKQTIEFLGLWEKINNKNIQENIRDYSSVGQLVILSNIESMNSELIKQKVSQEDRLIYLNEMSINQLKSIIEKLENINEIK